MECRIFAPKVAAFAVMAVVGGCAGGVSSPDLVPVSIDEALGPVGFCQRGSSGQLTVTVKNQGGVEAIASIVQVEFFPGGTRTADLFGPGPSGSLPPGIAWDVQFLDPPWAACFKPDCGFQITVDSTALVIESNEANNAVNGRCIG
jgi:subtilase family serine protease